MCSSSLEVEFEVALKSLQNDQVTIAGYEVELRDLKGAASYAMDCIAVPVDGEEAKSVVDRMIDIPDRLLTLLKVLSGSYRHAGEGEVTLP
jgi:hypothetical protein